MRPQLSAGLPYFHVDVSETYIIHIVHLAAAVVKTEICPQSLVPVKGKGGLKKIGSCHIIHCRKNNGKLIKQSFLTAHSLIRTK